MAEETTTDKARYWIEQLDHAQQHLDSWQKKADQVVARYRDERGATELARSKFNILWSNIQVLQPSLYGRPAKPEVSRRYMDADPIGRLASTMLERVLQYEVEQFPDFDSAMRNSVEDRLLPGRGIAWIRYCPVITSETLEAPAEIQTTNTEPIKYEKVDSAHSPVDYVYWKDFLHSPARIWDEVWWCSRWVYLTKEQIIHRFGEEHKDIPVSEENQDESQKDKPGDKSSRKAKIAEIWDKRSGTVIWIAKGYPKLLDTKPDPLTLEGFFPCPEPLLATTTTGSLIPVPDYVQYQDQARELDDITYRLSRIVKAIKATGVFNAEFKELSRLLSDGADNKLFGVTNWQALAEKNGLAGAVDMLDISILIQAFGALLTAREQVKQTIYEICGISDILRGATKAEETLGAQQLKANFGSLRLKKSQVAVARFASDIFKLKAQIICKFYPPALIVQMSGIQGTLDGADESIIQQALKLLQDSTIRDFHISVESDSLAQVDDEAEKQAASEAITALSTFLQQAGPMAEKFPESLPLISEALLFLMRRYRAGRALEAAIERTMTGLQQKAQMEAQNPKKSEAEMEAEAQQKSDQLRAQVDTQAAQMKAQFDSQVQQAKLQAEMQLEQMKAQLQQALEQMKTQAEVQMKQAEIQSNERLANLEAQTKIQVAQIQAQASLMAKDKEIQRAEQESAKQKQEAEVKEKAEASKPAPTAAPAEVTVNLTSAKTKSVKRDERGLITEIVES